MKLFITLGLLFLTGFSKSEYFNILAGSDQKSMSNMLNQVQSSPVSSDQKAYLGALKMRMAGYKKTPKEKLSAFKSGQKLLESVIKANPKKTEYRFLRLIVQEHAPKILNYQSNIKSDALFIASNYKSLPTTVKQAIISYDKKSGNLNL